MEIHPSGFAWEVGFINFHVKSIFLGLKDFLLRCREVGIEVRPEGVRPDQLISEASYLLGGVNVFFFPGRSGSQAVLEMVLRKPSY